MTIMGILDKAIASAIPAASADKRLAPDRRGAPLPDAPPGVTVATPTDAAEVMAGASLFNGITPAALEAACKRLYDEAGVRPDRYLWQRWVNPQETVIEAGEDGRELGIVADGMFRLLYSKNSNMVGATLGYLGPGDIFGEAVVFDGSAHTTSLVAATEGKILLVSRAAVEFLIQKFPPIATAMLRIIYSRAAGNAISGGP